MRRVRIESDSQDLLAGFVAGVAWVNDSAIAVVGLDDRGRTAVAILEDRDGPDEDALLSLTINGIEEKK